MPVMSVLVLRWWCVLLGCRWKGRRGGGFETRRLEREGREKPYLYANHSSSPLVALMA